MKNPNPIQIPVEDINSSSIRALARIAGATHATELGWAKVGDGPDGWVTAYKLNDKAGTILIDTSGDCITEDEPGYAETLELILEE